ncbi:hypothetical protein [Streptomyces sp. NPDC001508]
MTRRTVPAGALLPSAAASGRAAAAAPGPSTTAPGRTRPDPQALALPM